ncbi:unnamed protein product, partial [Ectocarpus sp. 12 AP-2014]
AVRSCLPRTVLQRPTNARSISTRPHSSIRSIASSGKRASGDSSAALLSTDSASASVSSSTPTTSPFTRFTTSSSRVDRRIHIPVSSSCETTSDFHTLSATTRHFSP